MHDPTRLDPSAKTSTACVTLCEPAAAIQFSDYIQAVIDEVAGNVVFGRADPPPECVVAVDIFARAIGVGMDRNQLVVSIVVVPSCRL